MCMLYLCLLCLVRMWVMFICFIILIGGRWVGDDVNWWICVLDYVLVGLVLTCVYLIGLRVCIRLMLMWISLFGVCLYVLLVRM